MKTWRMLVVLFAIMGAARAFAAERVEVIVDNDPLLTTPFGLDFLSDGSLVVADFGGNRICRIAADNTVSVIAGSGESGYQDGSASEAKFSQPHNIAVSEGDDILVADTANHAVRYIGGESRKVTTLLGNGGADFYGDGEAAIRARCSQAYHVAVEDGGYLLADLGNRRIRRVKNGIVETIAGNGESAVPKDGAVAAEAPLVDPRAVAAGKDRVWILERTGSALRYIDKEGKIFTAAGTGEAGPPTDGPALKCTLNVPKFLFVEKSGDVLIADSNNHVVRRYELKTQRLVTVVGTGNKGKGASGTAPLKMDLNEPHGVAVSPDGTLYISDSTNGRVLKIVKD